jgi:phosphonate transport system ATP-binding protein
MENQVPDAVVRVVGLTKRYGDHTLALDNVSFQVPRGQFVALIGLSGAGKSTLLRQLNGLSRPTTGRVEVLETDVVGAHGHGLRALRRRVGLVSQQFNLVGRVTCMENVLAGALGRLRGPRLGLLTYSSALRREALEHLGRVGLANQAFQRAETLSGGQQQRVAIARSLMQRPELLLADEPVASLDPESSHTVMGILHRIQIEDRLTVISSLHQVQLALDWADRIIGLYEGRIVLDCDPALIGRPEVMRVYHRVESDPADQVPKRRRHDLAGTCNQANSPSH